MDHSYAIENHTAERYLLQELNEEERDAYEEHFFSCSACAEEVRIATEFMENARQLVQDEIKAQLYGQVARRSIWGSWLNWRSMLHPMPAMACLLLVFASGFGVYQNRVTIPDLKHTRLAQVSTSAPITLNAAHGDPEDIGKGVSDKPFSLRFALPPGDYSSYTIDIRTESNLGKFSFDVPQQQQASNPVEIWLAAGALSPGKYVVVIQGVNTSGAETGVKGELERLSFEVVLQK